MVAKFIPGSTAPLSTVITPTMTLEEAASAAARPGSGGPSASETELKRQRFQKVRGPAAGYLTTGGVGMGHV